MCAVPPDEDCCASTGGTFFFTVPVEFASAVGSPRENRFVVGVEELGECLGFPSCCAEKGIGATREETAPELAPAAVPGEKGLGLMLRCWSCEALD